MGGRGVERGQEERKGKDRERGRGEGKRGSGGKEKERERGRKHKKRPKTTIFKTKFSNLQLLYPDKSEIAISQQRFDLLPRNMV